jgi:uncharacterized protein (TIGR03437 family)
VSPPVASGQPPVETARAVAPVTVVVDGITVTPEFAGLAGCCVGLNQVNFRLPAAIRSGNGIPVTLAVGGVTSNLVTIAVE